MNSNVCHIVSIKIIYIKTLMMQIRGFFILLFALHRLNEPLNYSQLKLDCNSHLRLLTLQFRSIYHDKSMLNLLLLCVTVSFSLLLQISSARLAISTSILETLQIILTTVLVQSEGTSLNFMFDTWRYLTFVQVVEYVVIAPCLGSSLSETASLVLMCLIICVL